MELAHCPLYRDPEADGYPNLPHLLGMESVPTLVVGNNIEIDMSRAEAAPAIAFTDFILNRDNGKIWNVASDASTTKLVAILDYSEPWVFNIPSNTTLDDGVFAILDWAQRGFVVYVANPDEAGAATLIEYTKRVDDMGILGNRRDFNGDGVTTTQDYNDFIAQWNLYHGKTTGCNWIHGDMDQDNDVDNADKTMFLLWWNAPALPGQQPAAVPIDLGAADPEDVLTLP